MTHQPPANAPHTEIEVSSRLLQQLERELRAVFEAGSTEPDEARGILQEALLAVTSRHREIENPVGLEAMDRLRRLKYWHDRRQEVCEAVDRVLVQLLESRETAEGSPASPSSAEGLIDRLPPRCRNLLRLRYGLDRASDAITAKLSERKAGIRKTTARCLTTLARSLIERGLAAEKPADRA